MGILSKYKKEILLLIIVSIVCLLVFEAAVRISGWPVPTKKDYPEGMTIYNESRGYALNPGFQGTFPNSNVSISINSKGLRDGEHNYEKQEGKFRILALGDSVTFGSGVPHEYIYHSVIEKNLIEKGYDVEVLNAGVGGYEFSQQKTYYLEEGYKYNPDIVIFGVVLNDLGKPDLGQIKSNFEKYNHETPYDSPLRSAIKKTCNSCVFVYSIMFNFNKRYADVIYGFWEDEEIREDYFSQLEELDSTFSGRGSEMVLVVFPYTWQFSEFNDEYSKGLLPQEKLKEFGEQNGIEVIDLYPVLNREDYFEYFIPYDNLHLNEEGNVLVADYITEELLMRGMIG